MSCRSSFFRGLLLFFFAGGFCSELASNVCAEARPFEKLEHCILLPNPSNDGDSFHVKWKNKEFIFRLYFVDTPETEARFPERVQAQAKYFGVNSEEAIRLGKIAATFTNNKLAPKPFTVYTRWQDAKGESRLPRYYAIIVVEDEQLAELLVANGLARVFGTPANLPTDMTAKAFEAHLRVLESQAKHDHLGGWSLHGQAAPASANSSDAWEKLFPHHPASPPAP